MGDRPHVDATELTQAEWFALAQIHGNAPGALLHRIDEARKQRLGMSQADVARTLQSGVEQLLARGYLAYVTGPDGLPLTDATGVPIIETVGVIVSRLQEYKPTYHGES